MSKAPILILALEGTSKNGRYKTMIWILTFFIYCSYHLSRRPISVVQNALHKDCNHHLPHTPTNASYMVNVTVKTCPRNGSWAPFDDEDKYHTYFAALDASYLAAYAVGMFISGHIAERMNLRYFLAGGMILSGIVTAMFGVGYAAGIHSLVFYVAIQVVCGLVQSSGWPGVVATMGNWFGKGRRGLIMGVWNSHTSLGNILGGLIGSAFLTSYWETHGYWFYSFFIPGAIIAAMGVVTLLVLVPHPEDVGLPDPNIPSQLDTPSEQQPLISAESEENNYGSTKSTVQENRTRTDEDDIFENSSINSSPSTSQPTKPHDDIKPITLLDALKVPGVIEYSFCLFFAKLVSYTFLYWLPDYIKQEMSRYVSISNSMAGNLSTIFDLGGVGGSIAAGFMSDVTGSSAITCAILFILGTPMMVIYQHFGALSYTNAVALLLVCGFLVNGPYCLITTSVSADLGTHPSLAGNSKALATVTAIIDGVGSLGAALGPALTGIIEGLDMTRATKMKVIFYILIASYVLALLLISRLVVKEIKVVLNKKRERQIAA